MQFLVTCRRVLNCYYNGLKLFFGFFELLVRFNDLLDRCDLLFRLSRFVDSHQRFHSASAKTSPISHSLISCALAFPSKLSKMFCTSATGFSLARFFTDAMSVAFRARKCSGASGVRFSAAYCACIG